MNQFPWNTCCLAVHGFNQMKHVLGERHSTHLGDDELTNRCQISSELKRYFN